MGAPAVILTAAERDQQRLAMIQQINLTTRQVDFLTNECRMLRTKQAALQARVDLIEAASLPWWQRVKLWF